ncbi:hypothetical protein [Nocardia altamirensis]|uniref:hypothetical protein n=1 Tax=Nocardia altamirensis TaxID=472158 RepID=UPI000A05C619|nr:hypothetical protein [Nocardia altamirensis]
MEQLDRKVTKRARRAAPAAGSRPEGHENSGLPELPCTEDQFRAWLTKSCAAQGVPVVIRDPETIAKVAVLLGASGPRRRSRGVKP